MDKRSVPNFLNCSRACSVASCPILTNATTAPVPTRIPKIAKKERSLAPVKLAKASLICWIKSTCLSLS